MDDVINDFEEKNDNLSEAPAENKIDAIINVEITSDGLKAYINIEPPVNGGAAPKFEALKAKISEYGVSYNVDIEKLKDIEANPVYNRDIIFASGVAPVNGIDGTVSFKIAVEEKSLKPKENEDGRVDFRDLDIVENVTEGQVLCEITPPTEGSPGISVKGEELPQKKGKPVRSYLGKNTQLNEDGTAILSKIDGQVEFNGLTVNVDETFYVQEDVDNSTGNIKVVGNLIVPGMVLPGFKVEAGGNISVKGTVEAAAIKADGNVNLQSGITGSDLNCNGDLRCRFIENCNVSVRGNINAEYIINSNIKCGKNIKIIGRMAKIIGGSCMAGQNIETHIIGSVANVKTRLELGLDESLLKRQQELISKAAEIQKQIETIRPLIKIFSKLDAVNGLTLEKRRDFDKVKYSYDANIKLNEEIKIELEEIDKLFKTKGASRIICTGTVYPGTQVVIGKASLFVANTIDNALIYYNEGNICIGAAR